MENTCDVQKRREELRERETQDLKFIINRLQKGALSTLNCIVT